MTTALQSSFAVWPDGDEPIFASLLRLRERMGTIMSGQNQVVSNDQAIDLKLRQNHAKEIVAGLMQSVAGLERSGKLKEARYRMVELFRRLTPVLTPKEQSDIEKLASALHVNLRS